MPRGELATFPLGCGETEGDPDVAEGGARVADEMVAVLLSAVGAAVAELLPAGMGTMLGAAELLAGTEVGA